jgi:hypothetical protein
VNVLQYLATADLEVVPKSDKILFHYDLEQFTGLDELLSGE